MMAASGGDLSLTVRGKTLPPGVRARFSRIEPPWLTARTRQRDHERERSWELELGHIEDMQGSPAAFDRANQVLDAIAQSLDAWIISTPTEELEYAQRAQVVKEWSDNTEIIRYFAHKKRSRDLERRASVIRFRLMIRLGQLLSGLKKVGLLTHGGARKGSRCTSYNLNDLQIDAHESANCQALAELKPKEQKEALDELRKGTKTINTLVKGLVLAKKRDQRVGDINRSAKLASRISLIYADPPWDYGGDQFPNQPHVAPQNQYKVMREEDIAAYLTTEKVKVASDAILFMWATVPLIEQGLRIMKAWDFKYKTMIVWDKQAPLAMGSWLPIQTELLLVGTKGKMPPPGQNKKGTTNLIPARKTRHSAKPDQFYELIERLYPKLRETRLELFARKRRDGWKYLGNDPALKHTGRDVGMNNGTREGDAGAGR